MMRAINTSVRLFGEVFDPPGPVVELGSYYPPGYDWLSDLRPYFPGREYVGCDLRAGNGVDRIEDVQELSFDDSSVGTMLEFEILEHVPDPDRAISEANRVLREDGLFALSTPFNHGLHAFPDDYWRFTASGMDRLLAPFPDKVIFALGPRRRPAFVFAVAAKTASAEFEARKRLFQERVEDTFRRTRLRGYSSVLRRTGRDWLVSALGRGELGAAFFDAAAGGGYFPRSAEGESGTNRSFTTS
ncbi:MAG: class I SAM-dependent methyltransferase [Gaiellaceae bacterium MAG52_C11]|nr:class I SAM-dependent methyltransferase [Candidatus Gaiellasilicea maunaloa]